MGISGTLGETKVMEGLSWSYEISVGLDFGRTIWENRSGWSLERVTMWKGNIDSWKTTSLEIKKLVLLNVKEFVAFHTEWITQKDGRCGSWGKFWSVCRQSRGEAKTTKDFYYRVIRKGAI